MLLHRSIPDQQEAHLGKLGCNMARGIKNRIQAVGLPVSACIDQHETFEPISPSQLLLCCSRIKVLGIGAVRNQSQLFTETAPGELALHARCKDDDDLGPLIEGRLKARSVRCSKEPSFVKPISTSTCGQRSRTSKTK